MSHGSVAATVALVNVVLVCLAVAARSVGAWVALGAGVVSVGVVLAYFSLKARGRATSSKAITDDKQSAR